ncbi:uncharacterized protein LOC108093390 [Drosophila ficusphila]|uniref:uncharacterized protein LOC108093390 n=1 Tax=Drosophila ficusphila TaxID=30025 RepID=UPI001C8A10A1|nr:uncharacterized protein LOC108093390 [Drosophila ficusphila]
MRFFGLVRVLILSTLFWLLTIELLIYFNSTGFADLVEFVLKPYREKVRTYEVGLRSQRWNDDRIAKLLQKQVRIHCLVYMDPSDFELGPQKAVHVRNTWGRRCNHLTIVNQRDTSLLKAYLRIYEEFHGQFDWLLVVYLDSYVVMENLRRLLAHHSPAEEIFFEAQHDFYIYAHVGQVSTTDYIFSREALEQLATRNCLQDEIFLRECLKRMKRASSEGLQSFKVSEMVIPFTLRLNFWLWPCAFQAVYKNQSWESCFRGSILYPYCRDVQMHVLEFLLYHLRPFGHVNPLPELRSPTFPTTITHRPLSDRVARFMFRSVRIICLVLTWPKNYMSGVRGISQTWGTHCNRVVFYGSSSQTTPSGVEIVGLNISDSRSNLWGKTKAAFGHAYRNYGHEAEWFFKADDDTYAIMENMRQLLHSHSPETPIYFGSAFKLASRVYMSGGAGYVLSKRAVELLVKGAAKKCQPGNRGTEDFEMGKCLRILKVKAGDSRDLYGRHRFFSLSLEHFLIPSRDEEDFWLGKYLSHSAGTGMECCSTYSISMHNVSPYEMHFLEAILYKSRPFGIIADHPPLKVSRKKRLWREQYGL